MVGDGLQAAISALVALHNFQQNSHHMLLSNLTDQPLIAQLGKDVLDMDRTLDEIVFCSISTKVR